MDVVPTVTPYRVYELPQDALILLRDLDPSLFPTDTSPIHFASTNASSESRFVHIETSPVRPTEPINFTPVSPTLTQELKTLQEVTTELLAYVRDNPAYLTKQLFFI